jgi:hypothetical protein
VAAISVVVIACDLLQYVAITSMAEKALAVADKDPNRNAPYDNKSFAYRAQAVFYYMKFWLLVGGSGLLLSIIYDLFRSVRK